MKAFKILTASVILYSLNVQAQKVTVEENKDVFAQGTVACFKLMVPYAATKDVAKNWKSWLKEHEGKIQESNNVVFSDNTAIKEFGTGTADLYTRYEDKKQEGTLMTVAYDVNGKYVSAQEDPNKAAIIKGQLIVFGKRLAIYELDEQLKKETSKNKSLLNKKASLEQGYKDYTDAITKNKSKIEKAENELTYTDQALEKKKEEIVLQKRIVDAGAGANDEKAKEEKKRYKNLSDDQLKLEKKQRDLKNDIVDYRNNISKNEAKIRDNTDLQEKTKKELESSSSIIDSLKVKLNQVSE